MATLGTAAKKDTTDCIYNKNGRQWSAWLAAVCWHMGQIKNSSALFSKRRFTSDMNHTNPQLKCKNTHKNLSVLQTFWVKIEIYSLLSFSCLSLCCSSCAFALLPFTVCAQTSSHGDLKKTLSRLSAHSFSGIPPRLGENPADGRFGPGPFSPPYIRNLEVSQNQTVTPQCG